MIQVEQSQLAEEQTLVMLDLVEGILRVAVAVKLPLHLPPSKAAERRTATLWP